MPVTYTGPDGPQDLIPAPLVVLQKNFVRGSNELITHVEYLITLTGTILNVGTSLDSPSVGSDEGFSLDGILGQQKYLRRLFSQDGGRLEITAPSGGGGNSFDAYCMLESMSFDRSVWVNIVTYTIVLKTRAIESSGDVDDQLDSFSESWNVVENEDSTYNISHQLSAKGAISYTGGVINNPLIAASGWVANRMYTTDSSGHFSPLMSSNLPGSGVAFDLGRLVNQLPSITNNFWNKFTTQTCDPQNYTYSATESFVYNPSGVAREIWSISVNYQQDNLRSANINVNGSIFGYSDKLSNLDGRNTNASGYFLNNVQSNLYMRASSYAPNGFTVSPQPSSKQISYERPQGIVRYTYNFLANNGTLIPNAIEENISIYDIAPTDVFAQISIPGRTAGPLLQRMFTQTAPERTLNISATLVADSTPLISSSLLSAYLSKPNTDALVAIVQPNAGFFYVREDREEWNPVRRQYSRNVAWVLPTNNGVSGMPSAPRNLPPN